MPAPISPTLDERLVALRATKLRHTKQKQDLQGAMDFDGNEHSARIVAHAGDAGHVLHRELLPRRIECVGDERSVAIEHAGQTVVFVSRIGRRPATRIDPLRGVSDRIELVARVGADRVLARIFQAAWIVKTARASAIWASCRTPARRGGPSWRHRTLAGRPRGAGISPKERDPERRD